jgi:hypothetical protein
MRIDRKTIRRTLLVLTLIGLVGASAGAIHAAFFNSTANPSSSFNSDRIFPRTRYVSAWDVRDASGGAAETNSSDPVSYVDARPYVGGTFGTTANTSKYFEFNFNSPLPPGSSVSSASFTFTFASHVAAGDPCYYLETRRASDNTLLATYGSSGSPIACMSGVTMVTTTTSLPILTTTTDANDLRVRVIAWDASNKAVDVDAGSANVTTSLGVTYPLYETSFVDNASGTPTTTTWAPQAADSATYTSVANWATTFSGTRYVKWTFPIPIMPTGATVTSVSLEFSYKSATNGDTTCWYADVLQNTTVLATHGSSGTPVSCNATNAFVTDTVSLPEVDTPAELNNLVLKAYLKNSGTRKSAHDVVRLVVQYELPYSGCADPGARTLTSTADSYVQQGAPTTNSGTATTMLVQPNSGAVRRSLVNFDLPLTPDGCTVTSASLKLWVSATGGSRTMNAYQSGGTWTETGVTWNNQPANTGSAVGVTSTAASSWTTWTVTSIVQAQYSGSNYGFIVQDSNEGSGTTSQTYHTRENTNDPQLVVTFG